MPYNEQIETRIKKIISRWKNIDQKNMFGGVCHLLNGNMFCGVYKDFLILRLGEEKAKKALKKGFYYTYWYYTFFIKPKKKNLE